MKRLATFTIILGLLLLSNPALAQGDIILRADQADAQDFPTVQVDVTVRDLYGVPVQGLTTDDFTISEDHSLAPRPIDGVTAIVNPDLPIAVVVVLDVSGSMAGQPMADAKTAALRFLDRLGADDRAAVIAFADTVDLEGIDPAREHPFTGDIKPLYDLVEGLKAKGDTPLYDVAYKAVRWAAAEPAGNRAVLLLSDGKEDAGTSGKMGSHTANEDTAIREANRSNVPVFTIGLGKDVDEPYLRRLALETGGIYQKAPDSASLVEVFQNTADLLKQQMRITYQSGVVADGGEHTIRVEVRAHERVASDEVVFVAPPGPTPEPGEELTATPTPEPPTPVPEEPTQEPKPTSPPAAEDTPTPTATPPPPPDDGGGNLLPWLAGLGGAGVLLATGVLLASRRRGRRKTPLYRCAQCGHDLDDPDAPCPACGAQDSFQAPES